MFVEPASFLDVLSSTAAAVAALAACAAAWQARRQTKETERFQRELAIDSAWMRYHEFYERCIDLYTRHPGMPMKAYLELQAGEQRRMNLAALALLQALDQAHRAGDGRAAWFEYYLRFHEGPLCTDGAIHPGGIASPKTIGAWNEVRYRNGKPPLMPVPSRS